MRALESAARGQATSDEREDEEQQQDRNAVPVKVNSSGKAWEFVDRWGGSAVFAFVQDVSHDGL
jgi:hypothetical protein